MKNPLATFLSKGKTLPSSGTTITRTYIKDSIELPVCGRRATIRIESPDYQIRSALTDLLIELLTKWPVIESLLGKPTDALESELERMENTSAILVYALRKVADGKCEGLDPETFVTELLKELPNLRKRVAELVEVDKAADKVAALEADLLATQGMKKLADYRGALTAAMLHSVATGQGRVKCSKVEGDRVALVYKNAKGEEFTIYCNSTTYRPYVVAMDGMQLAREMGLPNYREWSSVLGEEEEARSPVTVLGSAPATPATPERTQA